MSSINNDYSNLMNQQKLANANSLLGTGNAGLAGMSGDMLQQWAMLGANTAAYKKLLEAEKTGSIKQNQNYSELLSDRYFNDNYDPKTQKLKKATYTPVGSSSQKIDAEATSGDVLNDMRTLALAAINNQSGLNSTHYDFFETMRQSIASNLVTKGGSSGTETTVKDAGPATAAKTIDYRLLLEDQTVTVAGNKGEKTYNFKTGDSLQDIVSAINADSEATGVKAEVAEKDGKYEITFTSAGAGKDQFVRVDQVSGDLFAAAGSSIKGTGTDAVKGNAETVATGDDTQAAMAAGFYTGKLFEDTAFTITGFNGSQSFSFAKGATAEEVATAINDAAAQTGVKAELIRNENGEVEGIGLLAEKAGAGNFIQVQQTKGDLFAQTGKTVSVAGTSKSSSSSDGPAINNLNDLGRVSINGQTYSFADLAPGGKASLAHNPDAALAVIDQAIRNIYEGRAQIKGFDPADTPMPGVGSDSGANAGVNALKHNDNGSDAVIKWFNQYAPKDERE